MVAKGRKEAMVKSKNNKVDNFVIYSNSTYKIAKQYFSVLLKFKIYVYLSKKVYSQKGSMDWFLYDNGLRHERVMDSEFAIIECYEKLNNILFTETH